MLTSFGNGRACFDTDLSNKQCNKVCHFCAEDGAYTDSLLQTLYSIQWEVMVFS